MTTLEAPQHTGEFVERAVEFAKGLGRFLTHQFLHDPQPYESDHYRPVVQEQQPNEQS